MATPQKTIVISDIHISNGAAYSWFLPPYPLFLTEMLTDIAQDSTVAELVLLGDVFDLWLYPLDVVPWTVDQILAANPGITGALRQCVGNIPNVYYMNGNHDMDVTVADLEGLKSGNKSVQLVTPDQYGSIHQYQRRLEHGHAVDMFSAPDPADDTIQGYPLGYFIARMVATAADQSAAWEALKLILQSLGTTHRALAPHQLEIRAMGSLFVEAIIALMEKLADIDDGWGIRSKMNAIPV
jgi:UDP-2,3-diacylglucosamine pyrophosphatase LpxH